VTSNIADIAPCSVAMRIGLIGKRDCSKQLEIARATDRIRLQRSAFLVAALEPMDGQKKR